MLHLCPRCLAVRMPGVEGGSEGGCHGNCVFLRLPLLTLGLVGRHFPARASNIELFLPLLVPCKSFPSHRFPRRPSNQILCGIIPGPHDLIASFCSPSPVCVLRSVPSKSSADKPTRDSLLIEFYSNTQYRHPGVPAVNTLRPGAKPVNHGLRHPAPGCWPSQHEAAGHPTVNS